VFCEFYLPTRWPEFIIVSEQLLKAPPYG